jgi:predicted HAD superfamily Cof-like phosphohydrolase
MQDFDLQEEVKSFMRKAGQNVPNRVTIPTKEERLLSCRLLLEEVLEYIEAAGFTVSNFSDELTMSSVHFVNDRDVNFVEMLDAVGDIMFVAQGRAVETGLDLKPILREVCESNQSKFIDGKRCPETGKWKKGPSFREPDLKSIIEKQINKKQEEQLEFKF